MNAAPYRQLKAGAWPLPCILKLNARHAGARVGVHLHQERLRETESRLLSTDYVHCGQEAPQHALLPCQPPGPEHRGVWGFREGLTRGRGCPTAGTLCMQSWREWALMGYLGGGFWGLLPCGVIRGCGNDQRVSALDRHTPHAVLCYRMGTITILPRVVGTHPCQANSAA